MESYQRAQAVVLLQEMVDRVSANRSQAANYAAAGTVGTGDAQPTTCTGVATGANRDVCEWSNALKGAGETKGTSNVGAMINAHGCIVQIQAPNPATGICAPGMYRVTVTWQALQSVSNPNYFCAGDVASGTLRSVSSQLTIGLQTCS